MTRSSCSPDRSPQTPTPRVALSGLALLALLASACGVNEVVHGLTEREANEILVILGAEDIAAQKMAEEGRVVTWKVVVPAKDGDDARRTLVDCGLPKPTPMRLKDVFAESGMIPTQSEEKAKMLMGIQGEIEKKLLLIPGVVDVHAQVVIPDKQTIRDVHEAKPMPMAAVVITYTPVNGNLLPYKVEDIQKAVAASVEELTPERVTVLSYRNKPTKELLAQCQNQKVPSGDEKGACVGAATKKVMGINVESSKKNITKFFTLLAVAGGLVLVLLILWIIFVLSRIGLKRQLSKALAENMAYKKARGDQAAPAG